MLVKLQEILKHGKQNQILITVVREMSLKMNPLINFIIVLLCSICFIPYTIYDAFVSHVLGWKYNTYGFRVWT